MLETKFTYDDFCQEATEFIRIRGEKASWEGQCEERLIDKAKRGLVYCFLHMQGTDQEVKAAGNTIDAIMIDFGMRDILETNIPKLKKETLS